MEKLQNTLEYKLYRASIYYGLGVVIAIWSTGDEETICQMLNLELKEFDGLDFV